MNCRSFILNCPLLGITGHLRENEQFQWLMLNIEGKDIEFVKYEGKLQVVGYNGSVTDIEYPRRLGSGRSHSHPGAVYMVKSIAAVKKAVF